MSIKAFHTLLNKLGQPELKEVILEQYGVSSSKDLSAVQMREVIANLNASLKGVNDDATELKRYRSKVLQLATTTGLKHEDNYYKFNNWMLKRSPYKKELFKHTLNELKTVIKQLSNIERKMT